MYIGSVRFYKHLILALVAMAIIVPLVLCILLGVENRRLNRELAGLAAAPSPAVTAPASPSPTASQEPSASPKQTQGAEPVQPPIPTREPERPGYQSLYPELYADNPDRSTVRETGVVYLTFDDGPSVQTGAILAALEEADVKATFFVNGGEEETTKAWLEEIAQAGHTIGMHSYSHEYETIYASVEDFLADYDRLYHLIYEATGTYPTIFRFPGGSVNGYNGAVYQELIAEMTRRGFVYFDWDVSGQDASPVPPEAEEIVETVTAGLEGKERAIVQLHASAGRTTTPEALSELIETCRELGYTFEPLTGEVVPVVFGYNQE